MNILKCKDKDGITVICSQDTWKIHIVPKHPEMEGCEAHVKAVIEHPYKIYQDSTDIKKKIIYNPTVLPKAPHSKYLRVVIEYQKRKLRQDLRGYVHTAFACVNVKKGDILIWEHQ